MKMLHTFGYVFELCTLFFINIGNVKQNFDALVYLSMGKILDFIQKFLFCTLYLLHICRQSKPGNTTFGSTTVLMMVVRTPFLVHMYISFPLCQFSSAKIFLSLEYEVWGPPPLTNISLHGPSHLRLPVAAISVPKIIGSIDPNDDL